MRKRQHVERRQARDGAKGEEKTLRVDLKEEERKSEETRRKEKK